MFVEYGLGYNLQMVDALGALGLFLSLVDGAGGAAVYHFLLLFLFLL